MNLKFYLFSLKFIYTYTIIQKCIKVILILHKLFYLAPAANPRLQCKTYSSIFFKYTRTYGHTSKILQIWFQTTIKLILQSNESNKCSGFPKHQKCM